MNPNSVAVLYFDNASRDTNDLYLADGLTEEIISRLSDIERLEVKSRHAVHRFRGQALDDLGPVSRFLNVAYLVTGSVRRSGGRLRVGVELIRAAGGAQVWGHQYEQTSADVFDIQEDVARRVATEIVGRLLPNERAPSAARPPGNPAAYDHFLRGNFYLAQRTERAEVRAIEEYQRALDVDSTLVAARARLAYAFAQMLDWGWTMRGFSDDSLLARGTAAADRAIALDPRSSDGWMARGWLLMFRAPRTFDGVLAALERAVALDPRNAEAWQTYGGALHWLGRDSAAAVAWQRALRIEPGRPITLQTLAQQAYYARRYEEARYWVDSALAVDPGFAWGLSQRSMYRIESGDLSGAQADAEAAIRAGGPSLQAAANLAILVVLHGDTASARASLDSLRRLAEARERLDARTGMNLTRGYIALGDLNRALEVLERVEPRGLQFGQFLRNPPLDPLRTLPRFQRLVDETRPPGTR